MHQFELDILKVKKKKIFEDYNDEQLVKLAQDDIDKFRSNCYWSCPSCKDSISYTDSLSETGELYVHEFRCINKIKDKSNNNTHYCNEKMILTSMKEQSFNSLHLDELFARFQRMIVKESLICSRNIDSPDEVYSLLCSVFMKIVAMFARDSSFKKTSKRWFSSFFYRSIKNRIADLKKTNNYQKRTPLVKCAICGDEMGQITIRHLLTEGHSEIIEKILIDHGKHVMEDSGEIKFYDTESDDFKKRATYIGNLTYCKFEKSERQKLLEKDCISAYFNLYPNSYFKNTIVSSSDQISDENDIDVEDMNNESVIGNRSINIIEDINLSDTIDEIISIIFKGYNQSFLNSYFNIKYTKSQKIDIIKKIITDKANFSRLSNTELDKTFSGVKIGLTSEIFKMIKNNQDCIDLLRFSMSGK